MVVRFNNLGMARLCVCFSKNFLIQPLICKQAVSTPSVQLRSLSAAISPKLKLSAIDIFLEQSRCISFFNKNTAEHIWKGVTSVSNAGRRRGRGRGTGRKIAKNLNKGQVIGVGKANIVWPGLTTPVIRGREIVLQEKLPEDPERESKLNKLRNEMGRFQRFRLSPIERGWSGTKMPGRSVGPPDPIGEDTFKEFDCRVLEMKSIFNMSGTLGRQRRISVYVVSGNRKGLAGFALGKAVEGKTALRLAKNRSVQKLMYIERYNDHTVLHDFFTQFHKTKIFVKKMPEGYGLVCHRAIKTICEVIGIRDLYAKVEGSTTLQHIMKAFFLGLIRQKTHEQLAEETNLHLVEFRSEKDNFPQVVASPMKCKEDETNVPDFIQYVMGGRVVLKRKKFPPFFTKLPSWKIRERVVERKRNHDKIKLQLRTEYGELRSFLAEKHPECRNLGFIKKEEESP